MKSTTKHQTTIHQKHLRQTTTHTHSSKLVDAAKQLSSQHHQIHRGENHQQQQIETSHAEKYWTARIRAR